MLKGLSAFDIMLNGFGSAKIQLINCQAIE